MAHYICANWFMLGVVLQVKRVREASSSAIQCRKQSILSLLLLFFVFLHGIFLMNYSPTNHLTPLRPAFHLRYEKISITLIYLYNSTTVNTDPVTKTTAHQATSMCRYLNGAALSQRTRCSSWSGSLLTQRGREFRGGPGGLVNRRTV